MHHWSANREIDMLAARQNKPNEPPPPSLWSRLKAFLRSLRG